jgi:mannose-1-phosphate guanylyltransferase
VVLAGGVGSRFWPLSTPARPKQLLPLVTDRPLLVDTLARLAPLVPPARTLVLTNAEIADAVAELASGVPRANLIAEPKPAGTAAALAWAAAEIERRAGGDEVMISVHADWAVGNEPAFREALARAADAAQRHRSLLTVGVVPSRVDPGFGYIQPGAEVEPGVFRVARFVEKPDRAAAQRMRAEGFLWNSGIFAWRVDDYLAEVRARTPEVAPALDTAAGDIARFFAAVRPVSVDVGVLERSDRVLVLPGDFAWDDIGTWAALRRVRALDAAGNAASGPVHLLDARRNVVHAASGAVVLYGVDDLVVVAGDGLTLVTTTERAADLKTLIESLPPAVRERP